MKKRPTFRAGSEIGAALTAGLVALLLLPAADAAAGDADAHEFHRHHVGLFLGAGSREEGGDWEHGFAGGMDYEYRFSKWLGVGFLAEGTAGDLRDGVFAGLVFVHPWKGLLLAAGPGAEVSSHGTEYITRLGVAYQFPIGERFTIAPNFNVDLLRGDPTYIYGIVLGVGF
jgi:hypothetical protein